MNQEVIDRYREETFERVYELGVMSPADDQYSTTVSAATKMFEAYVNADIAQQKADADREKARLEADLARMRAEAEVKKAELQAELDRQKLALEVENQRLAQARAAEETKNGWVKYGVEVLKDIGLSVGGWLFFSHLNKRMYKFEETGSISSQASREINNLNPLKNLFGKR